LTSADRSSPEPSASDFGLLSPGRAGSRVEAETGDGAYLEALLDAEAALARAQAGLGLIPEAAGEAVAVAAETGRFDPRALALAARRGGNPVIPLVAALREAVGAEHADAVHRGATSQDIMDTASMLVADRARAVILGDLDRIAAALAALALRHRVTPMAARTLTQQAVPTTFGLKAAGWRSLVLDAHDRLVALTLPAQLGGAAGTLAALIPPAAAGADGADADRGGDGGDAIGLRDGGHELPGSSAAVFDLVDRFAVETGLEVPDLPWHVLRTPVVELGSALALTAGALGKFAADVLLLGRVEIGEVVQRGAGGGSSAMPHKANPVDATLVASAARQVPALVSVLHAAMAAEDERPAGAWHAEWQTLRETLRQVGMAAELAAELAESLEARPERMARNLELSNGLILTERLVGELEPLLGRRAARELLTGCARTAAERRSPLLDVLIATPDISTLIDEAKLTADRLAELLDPAGYLGAAPALVDHALSRPPCSGR
jgi:3-carboxy-cis,cis-muconate cycloisomerase